MTSLERGKANVDREELFVWAAWKVLARKDPVTEKNRALEFLATPVGVFTHPGTCGREAVWA